MAPLAVPRLPGTTRVVTLGNGLTVCLLENRRAPVVTTALFYRAGARDEAPGQGGTAHFLEHMMFKGSSRYGPGEIDRRTQALGGTNNAFTGHDLTAYYFDFAPDRWHEAVAIEADRMTGLTLDAEEVAAEKQVILEEIAMYEDDPWDALDQAVHAALFGAHPYGRPVLGRREDLAATGARELAAFHRRFYRPANAILVLAGDVGEEDLPVVEEAFGGKPDGAAVGRHLPPPPEPPQSLVRLERRKGDVSRLLLDLPGTAGTDPDHPILRLAVAILATGRASRLHRALVDEGQLCAWVSADLGEGLDPGFVAVAAELVPDVEPAEVEEALSKELAAMREEGPTREEVERAHQVVVADWVMGHERVHQQALLAGSSLALFDLDHPERLLRSLLAADAGAVLEVAGRYLDPEAGGVLGWSLPDRQGS
jgi:zinc protease